MIIQNIFFLAGMLTLVSGFYRMKKTQLQLCGLLWMTVSLLLALCFHALWGAVLNWFSIPISTFSMGIADFVWGMVFLLLNRKEPQQYWWHIADFLIVLLLLIFVAVLGYARFGSDLSFCYRSVDSITHYYEAVSVMQTGQIEAMYFTALNGSFLAAMYRPFVDLLHMYRIEPMADLIYLYLAALLMFGIMRVKSKTVFSIIGGSFLCIIYCLGYPLNNLLAGFLYLGAGVLLIGMIIILADFYLSGKFNEKTAIFYLMLGITGLITCYALFAPPVYLALFVVVVYKKYKEKASFIQGIKVLFSIFFVPCIIGIYYTYFGIFKDGVTLNNAIVAEGFIYRNNLSDFVPIIPFAFLGILQNIKKRRQVFLTILSIVLAAYMIVLLCLQRQELASAYYYYKNNFLLWLILFLLAMESISEMANAEIKILTAAYGIIWCCVTLLTLNGNNSVLYDDESLVSYDTSEGIDYCKVFWYNYEMVNGLESDEEKNAPSQEQQKLYEISALKCTEESAKVFPVGKSDHRYFLNALTGQWDHNYFHVETDEYQTLLEEQEPEYICVIKASSGYQENREYLDQYYRIFENSVGFIAEYKKAE